jgi:hypothetical protein
MANRFDQCGHGTWPCAKTQADWETQGHTREQEMVQIREELAQKADLRAEHEQALRKIRAAEREGRTIDRDADPDEWEAEAGQ